MSREELVKLLDPLLFAAEKIDHATFVQVTGISDQENRSLLALGDLRTGMAALRRIEGQALGKLHEWATENMPTKEEGKARDR